MDRFIPRRALAEVEDALRRQPAVALLGPRQAGKTTLALEIARQRQALYLDLELPADRQRLTDAATFLETFHDRLVILDEIHRAPNLFAPLRGIIDRGRRSGRANGRFLILGSASFLLLRQSESLAGRLGRVELNPFGVLEVAPEAGRRLWIRGGLPLAFLAKSGSDSLRWRRELLLAYCERDLPAFGSRVPPAVLNDLFTMLAHAQGTPVRTARLASNLSLAAPTVRRAIELLGGLHLLRVVRPYVPNHGKRLVKSPRVYVRDSGLLHALLGIADFHAVAGHPVLGASWEGFVIENLLGVAPFGTRASWYRTRGGAELDLVLEIPGHSAPWGIEVKYGHAPRIPRGFYASVEDIQPERAFVVTSGKERYPLRNGVEAIGLREMATLLAQA